MIIRIVLVLMGSLALVAVVLPLKRRDDLRRFGGALPFALHALFLVSFGVALIVFASGASMPVSAVTLSIAALGVLDLVAGIVGRRRNARQAAG